MRSEVRQTNLESVCGGKTVSIKCVDKCWAQEIQLESIRDKRRSRAMAGLGLVAYLRLSTQVGK